MTVISVISSGGVGQQFGTGIDGNITITNNTPATPVNIIALYENDVVINANTSRGVNKGLNKGAGTYNPKLNQSNNTALGVPNCINFTINPSASITTTSWGAATDDKLGIIWVACIGKFTDNSGGTGINLKGKGASAGAGGTGISGPGTGNPGDNGKGIGFGAGGIGGELGPGNFPVGGAGAGHITPGGNGQSNSGSPSTGGIAYGTSPIPLTTWANLYGSGAGGGGAGSDGTTGGAGGNGGGAFRIYAVNLDISNGLIDLSGDNGNNGANGSGGGTTNSGSGGGGSGGTGFIETLLGSIIGTNKIKASAGLGATFAMDGGDGRQGRIHIVGGYSGSTSDPAIL